MQTYKTLTSLIVMIICCLLTSAPTHSDTLKAPVFSLPGQNKTVDLSKYKGKVIYLDFWASWCGPCKRSFPWMNELQKQYGTSGFEVIAVNLDTSRKDADDFLRKIPANFDVAFDTKGTTAKTYKLIAMPSSFIINRNGELVHKSLGYSSQEKKIIEAKIQQLTTSNLLAKR